jgi:hypothetical protein
VIDPSLQRCGAIKVRMLDEHLPKLGTAQSAGLPRSDLAQRNLNAFSRGSRRLSTVIKSHSAPLFPFSRGTRETSREPRPSCVHLYPRSVKNPPCPSRVISTPLRLGRSRSIFKRLRISARGFETGRRLAETKIRLLRVMPD